MSVERSDLTTAVALMRMALSLLDKAGETRAAAHLQHSIDVATGARVSCIVDGTEAWLEVDEAHRLASPVERRRDGPDDV